MTVARFMCATAAVCAALAVGTGAQGIPVVPTIARPSTATRSAGASGFLQRWLILEPIAVPGQLSDSAVRTTVSRDYFPGQLTAMPRDGEMVTVDGNDETITGSANAVRVNGNHNTVVLTAADQVAIFGNDNTVTVQKPVKAKAVQIANPGNRNKVTRPK